MQDMILKPGPKGFQLFSPQGNVLSVQYGHNNYVDNTDMMAGPFDPVSETTCVELAMWGSDGSWYRLTAHDNVCPYFPVAQLGNLIMLFYADEVEKIIEITQGSR